MNPVRNALFVVLLALSIAQLHAARLTGTVVDAKTNDVLPARVYLLDEQGKNHFVQSTSATGSALPYREQWVPMAQSKEQHTTISAHPFKAELPPGRYTLIVYRGKEYLPHQQSIEIENAPLQVKIPLQRWINMASRGWYSGETHVHRRHFELPNVMLAEDLNIAFPVTFWTTQAYEAPHLRPANLRHPPSPFGDREDRGVETIVVDPLHLIVPRNTEYEIFSIGEKRHTLGAIFVINHQTKFTDGMPPVRKLAELAHAEGALLDLDKHSWPWSLMLPPIAKVDLFELSNNSVWKTKFGFSRSGQPADYMGIELTDGHMTERGWLEYGFQCYYAMLNCGLKMTPTAGTASGVHPVPLGFSRVYVHPEGGFNKASWMAGLKKGRSFVTTGPMLLVTANDLHPSSAPADAFRGPQSLKIKGTIHSPNPPTLVELIVNGDVIESIRSSHQRTEAGAYQASFESSLQLNQSSWIIARCFTRLPDGRERFAHTAPFYLDVPNKPIRPKKEEIEYLTNRMKQEITRNQTILPKNALKEFEDALHFYQSLQTR